MGLNVLEMEAGNPANPEVTEKVEFLVDSGAIYSVVPTPVLQGLGIKPLAEQEFRLADGSKIARRKGVALFKYAGKLGGPTSSSAGKATAPSWARSRLRRWD